VDEKEVPVHGQHRGVVVEFGIDAHLDVQGGWWLGEMEGDANVPAVARSAGSGGTGHGRPLS
jgi:hypothetical protein